MASIDLKLEAWKNKLLDLGKRNRLINYKETKRSSLRIITPEIFSLWKDFVINEKSLEFPYIDEEQTSIFDDETNIELYYVTTNQSIREQQKTLRSLREKAKTAIEELGVNILYLSFGFLKWTESGNSDQSLSSPLILVPVSLTIESISDPYVLRIHEDEIVINPTLKYKLENDFGIVLPELEEDQELKAYFDAIKGLVSINKWDVIEGASLSLLSFLKINMYRDIDKHKDKIKSHAIIRSLSGDSTALDNDYDSINNFDHDKQTKPVDVFQVVDADSSQQDAIVSAKKGMSFILQGPPGTGKSQTITNIIAESIADGKKVLFVSEKMAALEVVHRRLSNAGLSDFCLTLHSYKANKKEILDQLGTVLNLTQKKANLTDEVFQRLDLLQSNKEKLNEYSEAIFTKVMPLEKTIYEVNGILANLQQYEEVIFEIQKVEDITPQKFNRYINLLNQFVHTVGKMSDDYKSNPWNGANVQNVSNELRHDIGANLSKLIPNIKIAMDLLENIRNDLNLEVFSSYSDLIRLIEIFKVSSASPLVPISWIIGDDITPLFAEIDEFSKLKMEFNETKNSLSSTYFDIQKGDSNLFEFSASELYTTLQIKNAGIMWKSYIDNNYCYSTWNKTDGFEKAKNRFEILREKLFEYISTRKELLHVFDKEIFDIDHKAMLSRFKTEYTSFLKIFKKQYKNDKKEVIGKYKNFVKKIDDETVISTLIKLRQIEELSEWMSQNSIDLKNHFGDKFQFENTDLTDIENDIDIYSHLLNGLEKLNILSKVVASIEEREIGLKNHYDYLYTGINTDWDSISKSLNWANSFRKVAEKYNLESKFVGHICSDHEKVKQSGEFITKIENSIQRMDLELQWFINLFDDADRIKDIKMNALKDKLVKCQNGLASLEEWIDFRSARQNCISEGLQNYIDKIQQLQIDTNLIVPIFKKRFYRLWLDAILPKYPAVMNFRRRNHDNTIKEFASLDRQQLEIAKARIQKRLIDNLPSLSRFTNGADEISILKRELGKQRRIMPIRKLFAQIPNLLLTLKPCLMMSPLSVSIFLESESYNFDLVIFDEASQISTENAIGAISRAKQVIIAGDSKQLPPTNFFTASISDGDYDTEDDDDYEDINAYESILDEAILLPERTLLWHYRSRHEHLIAFSNAKIYKNNLITFPSNVDKVSDNGVEYVYVKDGFYDKGGKKGNVIEAQKVAELVFDHFKRFPNRSLGVIAFGEVQQQAIDSAVRQMRMKDQTFEHFFKEDLIEEFFVKNLENVQGDERDTIIFSIGYAKPPQGGQMHMNFGPLSKSGGERRLNVAITRAKYNVKLVGSIMSTDIDLNRVTTEGPKLLRNYIDFAINGPSSILAEITESDAVEHDSPFEEAVYNFLDRKGYKIGTQIGCSGYRIDLAVKHPTMSGRYILGIECDGAAYHSARTARERDRLRQTVLEDMGWKIYRIWSTDWIKDPIAEGEKLVETVENALLECEIKNTIFDGNEIKSNNNNQCEDDFITIDLKEKVHETNENLYNFRGVEVTSFSHLPNDQFGYVDLGDCIRAVVDNEFPVHYDFLCKSLAPLFGNEKVTSKVRKEVDYKLNQITSHVVKKDDFLYPSRNTEIKARHNNSRPINYISTDELAVAMYNVASTCIGATIDSLCVETARAYGFQRSSEKINVAMRSAYEHLLSNGKVKEIDGKVSVI